MDGAEAGQDGPDSFSSRQRVAICVCTCRRPMMLERCLHSLAAQLAIPDIELHIIVVDNEPEPNNRALVAAVARCSPIGMRYVHQPKRGIAAARNAALDAAMEIGPDWIAFLDDDEVAEPDWIAELMAPEYRDTPILLGAIVTEYPAPAPFWVTDKRQAGGVKGKEGEGCKTGTTGNVRLSAALLGAGFRFDEGLGLMGGEDNELLTRARQAGFEIRRTLRAVVTETAHAERLTYVGQLYRAYWCAASDMRRTAIAKGWTSAILRKAHTVPSNLIFGAAEVAVSPLFVVLGIDAFKRRALGGGKKVAKGLGRGAAMLGCLPAPYRTVVGD